MECSNSVLSLELLFEECSMCHRVGGERLYEANVLLLQGTSARVEYQRRLEGKNGMFTRRERPMLPPIANTEQIALV